MSAPVESLNAGGLGVLGGSFNPVHRGHAQLALHAWSILGLARIDFVPCARPPHKPTSALLPFERRVELLRLVAAELAELGVHATVNELEAKRPQPSYTFDTLTAYARERSPVGLCFLLGAPDLLALPEWRRGLELLDMANFAAAPRDGLSCAQIGAFVARRLGRRAIPEPPCPGVARRWRISPGGTSVLCLDVPPVDMSSSAVRLAWRNGESLNALLPPSVVERLGQWPESAFAPWVVER